MYYQITSVFKNYVFSFIHTHTRVTHTHVFGRMQQRKRQWRLPGMPEAWRRFALFIFIFIFQ